MWALVPSIKRHNGLPLFSILLRKIEHWAVYLLVAWCRAAACPLEFSHIYKSWIAWVDLVTVSNCCNCQSEVRPLQNWSRPCSGSCSSNGQAGYCCIVVLGKEKTVIELHYTVVSLNFHLLTCFFFNANGHQNLLPDSVTSRKGLLLLQLASSLIHLNGNQVAKKWKMVVSFSTVSVWFQASSLLTVGATLTA